MFTLMFPGQGAQSRGMGQELFDEFAEQVALADGILGYSLRELCRSDDGRLDQTQYTQPALYVVNALAYLKRTRAGKLPDAVLGHSLGEFNALLAAGVFDFETGLKLVERRGRLMSEAEGGAMAAILRLSADDLRRTLAEHGLQDIDLANFNAPDQIVISGKREDMQRAHALCAERGIGIVPLNTSGAFHSKYMRTARERFDAVLREVEFTAPKITVISNYQARPYTCDNVFENLSNQISSPVLWSNSIEYLIGLGEMEFEEVGGKRVLTNLVGKIKASASRREAPAGRAVGSAGPAALPRPGGGEKKAQATPPFERSNPDSAEQKVRNWNVSHGIGTKVRSEQIRGPVLETRTDAVLLFGHRAGVYLANYHGYFDLDELEVVGET